jgi:dTMP kinase
MIDTPAVVGDPHPQPLSPPKGGRGERARFVTFEGIDGAGKSTLLESVVRELSTLGIAHVRTREPGGTALGESLRGLLLKESMAPLAETLLMFAARAEHVRTVIAPALARGEWVICDRFLDASYAYQGGGRAIAGIVLDALAQWTVPQDCAPDLTVLVDIDPQVAHRRLAQERASDRFEEESAQFFARVRAAYLHRAAGEPGRFLVLDGGLTPGELSAQVVKRLKAWLT